MNAVPLDELTEDIMNMDFHKDFDESIACSASGSTSMVIVINFFYELFNLLFLLYVLIYVYCIIQVQGKKM